MAISRAGHKRTHAQIGTACKISLSISLFLIDLVRNISLKAYELSTQVVLEFSLASRASSSTVVS